MRNVEGRERERLTHWRMLECYIVSFAEGKHAKAAVTSLAFLYIKSRIKAARNNACSKTQSMAHCNPESGHRNLAYSPFLFVNITSQPSFV